MPTALVSAHAATRKGVEARPKARGIRFEPVPKPTAATENTSARSARLTPSSDSSGARNTLKA